MSISTGFVEEKLINKVTSLLDKNGIKSTDLSIKPCSPGRNNRVFILYVNDKKYLLKNYYSSSLDTRSRLQHEWTFLKYAEEINIKCVPKPIVCDQQNNIGIYEFVDGEKLSDVKLNGSYIQEAINFIQDLNGINRNRSSVILADASEACFSITDHIELVRCRIEILTKINIKSDLRNTLTLLIKRIRSNFEAIKNEIIKAGKKHSLSLVDELSMAERCISPSDFGFHNALRTNTGKLYFLDFEYAGWDDPAKMIADFFCQPEIEVSMDYFHDFAKGALLYNSENYEYHITRTKVLMSLFKLKWCCIMLNEFLPDAWERRKFAKNMNNEAEHHVQQIKKVEKALNKINI